MDQKENNRDLQRRFQERCRVEALAHYGAKCAECGVDDERVLDVYAPRGAKGPTSQVAYAAKRARYPKKYRVLCRNCRLLDTS